MNEFLHHYKELLSDPAHLAVELTLMLLVDGLLLGLLWPLAKRLIHRDIDRSHNYDHHPVYTIDPKNRPTVSFDVENVSPEAMKLFYGNPDAAGFYINGEDNKFS